MAGGIEAGVEAIRIPSVAFIPGYPEDGGLAVNGGSAWSVPDENSQKEVIDYVLRIWIRL